MVAGVCLGSHQKPDGVLMKTYRLGVGGHLDSVCWGEIVLDYCDVWPRAGTLASGLKLNGVGDVSCL